MPHVFKRYDHQDVADLISQYPLATLVTAASSGFLSRPLPMLADFDASGKLVNLVGHMARGNPLVAQLRKDATACFLFHGPHHYISPTLVPDRNWAPTWNYALLRVTARVEFAPQKNDYALRRLVEKMEAGRPDAWSVEELGARYDKLSQHIVAFDAQVTDVDATFKLGQDEKPEMFDSIQAGVGHAELRQWMLRFFSHDNKT